MARKNLLLLVVFVIIPIVWGLLCSNLVYIVNTLLQLEGRYRSLDRTQTFVSPQEVDVGRGQAAVQFGGSREKCAPTKGIVVSALLGLLGNNLFELAFANRMAAQLCWKVVYRNAWLAGDFLREGHKCFPNAFLSAPNVTAREYKKLGIDSSSLWKAREDDIDPWVYSLEKSGRLLPCRHLECNFTQPGTDMLLERLSEESSGYRVFYAKAFFVHHGWMRGWEEEIRDWLKVDSFCCKTVPPEDAVVIHVRDFGAEVDTAEPNVALPVAFYVHLLQHYDFQDRPVWIVCKPQSVNSTFVKELASRFPISVVQPGGSTYDAFCILQRAKTLVLSHRSTFSQAAALSAAPDAVVHYPVFNYRPFLTVGMRQWKYHLVSKNRSNVAKFEVPADAMEYRMDSETPEEVQIEEVGTSPIESIEGYSQGRFCAPWSRQLDDWWAHNPEWGFESASDELQCFKRYHDDRARFLRGVYDVQWSGNCTAVHTRHMWSSGWGADFSNVVDGLLLGFEDRRPFQITFSGRGHQWWHYAAVKKDGANPTCDSKDMFCYFLPLSRCKPGAVEMENRYPNDNETNTLRRRWLYDYAARQQQWLRRSVFDYINEKAPAIPTPCTAMHVRRSDVVLHDIDSRKYFPISFYLRKAELKPGENILLFTDDANAIEEVQEFHPDYNWAYLKRKRHRGSEGGWENQIPSENPREEVVVLLAIFELAKRCDAFVHTYSNMADVIYDSMASTSRPIRRIRADGDLAGRAIHNENNTFSENILKKRLSIRRKHRKRAAFRNKEE